MALSNKEINDGALAMAAGATLGLSQEETLQLLEAVAGKKLSKETKAVERGLAGRAYFKRKNMRASDEELQGVIGSGAADARIGPEFDNNQNYGVEKGSVVELSGDDESTLQNFGGSTKDGRTKNPNVAIDEQARARKKGSGGQSTWTPPSQRPGFEAHLDD